MANPPATWRRRPRHKAVGEYIVWSDIDRSIEARLLSTWLQDWHTPEAPLLSVLHPKRMEPDPLAEKIGRRCPACTSVRYEDFDRPIDVTILRRTYGGDTLTANKLRNVRLTLPLASIPSIIRIEILDLLAPYLDGHWLVGNVYLETGEQLAAFRSVVDRRAIPTRRKFSRDWFKYTGARLRECPRCRGLDCRLTMGGEYILASEIPPTPPSCAGPAIRLERGTLYVERSVAETLRLQDRARWPAGQMYRIPVHDERLDPIPAPYPRTWPDLVRALAHSGDFPFEEFGRFTSALRADVAAAAPKPPPPPPRSPAPPTRPGARTLPGTRTGT